MTTGNKRDCGMPISTIIHALILPWVMVFFAHYVPLTWWSFPLMFYAIMGGFVSWIVLAFWIDGGFKGKGTP